MIKDSMELSVYCDCVVITFRLKGGFSIVEYKVKAHSSQTQWGLLKDLNIFNIFESLK